MTLNEILTQILVRLREDSSSPVYFTAAEVAAAVNTSQRLFVFLTMCLEGTAPLTISSASRVYRPLQTLGDWMQPLELRMASNGGKLRPARLEEFDAERSDWETVANEPPDAYCCLGFDYIVLNRTPTETATVNLIYSRCPTLLSSGGAVPEIPTEHHQQLVDAGIVFTRLKEGAQEFSKELPRLDRFLAAAGQLAAHVRARNIEMGYDRLPPELDRVDLSKIARQMAKGAK